MLHARVGRCDLAHSEAEQTYETDVQEGPRAGQKFDWQQM